ncbi:MAG TPA: hypothetical protein VLM91_04055 [Candidatus Methylomirabilis sp.]|nr:hypothetical protein [Candidatus Methylomirabilis sp.]
MLNILNVSRSAQGHNICIQLFDLVYVSLQLPELLEAWLSTIGVKENKYDATLIPEVRQLYNPIRRIRHAEIGAGFPTDTHETMRIESIISAMLRVNAVMASSSSLDFGFCITHILRIQASRGCGSCLASIGDRLIGIPVI